MKNNDLEKKRMEPRKLVYEPPAVMSDEVFETLALACGKVSGTGGGLGCEADSLS